MDLWEDVAHLPPDVDWVEPGLALGGRPYAAQRAAIKALGIEVVIMVEPPLDGEVEAWAELGVETVVLPTRDWTAIPAERFDAVVAAVMAHRAAGRTVLLHCLAGVNRSPTFACAILCQRDGLSIKEALARVRDARRAASPTFEQLASLHA